MNKVSLIGNIVNDLELKDYKNGDKEGKYVRFTLAINEYNVKKNERIATFIEVVAFDKKAIILAHNVGKGSKLAVEGRLQTSNYLNSEGERRYKVDIVLNEFTFIEHSRCRWETRTGIGKTDRFWNGCRQGHINRHFNLCNRTFHHQADKRVGSQNTRKAED